MRAKITVAANDWFNFSTATAGLEVIGGDVLKQAVLKLNGHNRFTPERGPLFFRQWQPFIHHTNIPLSNLYVYSFALRPEEHQPSGTCNFSRIDNTMLHYQIHTASLNVNPLNASTKFTTTFTSCQSGLGATQRLITQQSMLVITMSYVS